MGWTRKVNQFHGYPTVVAQLDSPRLIPCSPPPPRTTWKSMKLFPIVFAALCLTGLGAHAAVVITTDKEEGPGGAHNFHSRLSRLRRRTFSKQHLMDG